MNCRKQWKRAVNNKSWSLLSNFHFQWRSNLNKEVAWMLIREGIWACCSTRWACSTDDPMHRQMKAFRFDMERRSVKWTSVYLMLCVHFERSHFPSRGARSWGMSFSIYADNFTNPSELPPPSTTCCSFCVGVTATWLHDSKLPKYHKDFCSCLM